MTREEELIGMILYIQSFLTEDEDIETIPEDLLIPLMKKWNRDILPYENVEHSGDCLKQPWTCLRCYLDLQKEFTSRFISIYNGAKEES